MMWVVAGRFPTVAYRSAFGPEIGARKTLDICHGASDIRFLIRKNSYVPKYTMQVNWGYCCVGGGGGVWRVCVREGVGGL
jgi:hypothetical protein